MMKQSKKTIAYCQKELNRLRESYMASLARTADYSNQTAESIDAASKEQQIHTSVQFRARMRELLPEINQALKRIDNNTFGICQRTGKKIEPNRLRAIPWTRISKRALQDLLDIEEEMDASA